MRSFVAVLLAVSLLAGCVSREGGAPQGEPERPAEPVELAIPIELRPVLETESTDPTVLVLPTDEGERLTLAAPILTLRELDNAEVEFEKTAGTWVLTIDLADADGTTFGDWTADHIGERLAMVADQQVLMAPTIQSAIPGGEIQISAQYTQSEARALLDKITGR